jgi:hypothetical protein
MADQLRHLIATARGVGLVAIWFVGATAFAQAPISTVHFTVFAARQIAGLAFLPSVRGAPQPIVFYPTARSPRYDYRGKMPLRFVDAKSKAVLAEATIPPDLHEVLLLFTPMEPGATTGLHYQVAIIDDNRAALSAGAVEILNLSGLDLVGTINRSAVVLKSGLNAPIPIGRTANIVLRTTSKNRSFRAYAGDVDLAADQRALLILFPPFYHGSLEVQSRLLLDVPRTNRAPASRATK